MLLALLAAMVLAPLAAATSGAERPSMLAASEAAWSSLDGYTATLKMHEVDGTDVQDRTYALTFRKPSDETLVITAGPGRGGKVTWSGGDRVVGSPGGLLSGMKLHLDLADARVTTLRGDTVAMAPFGWVLEHFRRTPGSMTQAPGPVVGGTQTTAVSLTIADPAANAGVTQEVVLISNATKLPVEARRYIGTQLVKEIHYSDVVPVAAH